MKQGEERSFFFTASIQMVSLLLVEWLEGVDLGI